MRKHKGFGGLEFEEWQEHLLHIGSAEEGERSLLGLPLLVSRSNFRISGNILFSGEKKIKLP